MRLWMSSEVDADIADDFRPLRNSVEQDVNAYLHEADLGEVVEEWACIPMITKIASGLNPEVMKFRKAKREAEFRLTIDHDTFLTADSRERRNLLIQMLQRSLTLFEVAGIKGFDCAKLSRALEAMKR